MDPDRFWTESLRASDCGTQLTGIFSAALAAVEPRAAVHRHVNRQGARLIVGSRQYSLDDYQRIFVVGAGKAGAPMASAILDLLSDRVTDGIIVVKEGYGFSAHSEDKPSWPASTPPTPQAPGAPSHVPLRLLEAGHPLPDARGVEAATQIAHLLEQAQAHDLVICLVSGGGSALNVLPAQDLSLDDLQMTTNALLACGADIHEFNTVRKHLEQLKGGQLARLAAPAELITLVLSDVVGDPLDVIASGPTVPDPTTFGDALGVMQRYQLLEVVPAAVVAHLQSGLHGEIPDTPKPGDSLFDQVNNLVIGSNRLAAQAALEGAKIAGFHSLLLTTCLQGEASQAGRFMAAIARQVATTGDPIPRPACLVAGGETTVTLHGTGSGGRNQELALGAVTDLAGLPGVILASLATDGGDGPTDAAGAVVTGETFQRARQLNLDPADYQARNDAYHYFAPLDDLLKPGPTQTNVNDLVFIFVF
jgi:glycerate 2-kinase